MTELVSDVLAEHTLETVQRWIDRGYALFVPDSPFCLASVARQLPGDAIFEMRVPGQNGSYAPLFMVHRKSLPEGRVSHPDKVRIVLAREIITPNGRATGVVHLKPVTASDEQMTGVVKDILEVAMGEE